MPQYPDGKRIHEPEWDRLLEDIPTSYTVSGDGVQAMAESNIKGGTDYMTGTDTVVIQNALNALTGGRTWKQKIVFKGTFVISTVLVIPSYTVVDLRNAKLIHGNAQNGALMLTVAAGSHDIDVFLGVMAGNSANQTTGTLTFTIAGYNCRVYGGVFTDFYSTVASPSSMINISGYNNLMHGIVGTSMDGIGCLSGSYRNIVKDCWSINATTHGFLFSGATARTYQNSWHNCYAISSGGIGFSMDAECEECTGTDCVATDAVGDGMNFEQWGVPVNKAPRNCKYIGCLVNGCRFADAGSVTVHTVENQFVNCNAVGGNSVGFYLTYSIGTRLSGKTDAADGDGVYAIGCLRLTIDVDALNSGGNGVNLQTCTDFKVEGATENNQLVGVNMDDCTQGFIVPQAKDNGQSGTYDYGVRMSDCTDIVVCGGFSSGHLVGVHETDATNYTLLTGVNVRNNTTGHDVDAANSVVGAIIT